MYAAYLYAPPTVVDLNGDGSLEIIIGSGTGFIYSIDCRGCAQLFATEPFRESCRWSISSHHGFHLCSGSSADRNMWCLWRLLLKTWMGMGNWSWLQLIWTQTLFAILLQEMNFGKIGWLGMQIRYNSFGFLLIWKGSCCWRYQRRWNFGYCCWNQRGSYMGFVSKINLQALIISGMARLVNICQIFQWN